MGIAFCNYDFKIRSKLTLFESSQRQLFIRVEKQSNDINYNPVVEHTVNKSLKH